MISDPVQLEKQEIDGKTYAPLIERLEIKLRTDEIEVESQVRTEITPGLYSICHETSAFTFGLLSGTKGKTLGYKPTREPKSQKWKEQSEGLNILDWMLLALTAVGIVMLALVSFGTLSAGAGIIAGILLGAVSGASLTKSLVALYVEGKGPTIDLFALNATGSIRWCTGARFDPVNAGLNGSFQIGGNLVAPKGVGPLMAVQDFQAEFAGFMASRTPAGEQP